MAKARTKPTTLTATFDKTKDTKNKVRFDERLENEDSDEVVGALYLSKKALSGIGASDAETVNITIEVA